MIQYGIEWYGMVGMVQYGIVWYSMAWMVRGVSQCGMVWYITVWYGKIACSIAHWALRGSLRHSMENT